MSSQGAKEWSFECAHEPLRRLSNMEAIWKSTCVPRPLDQAKLRSWGPLQGLRSGSLKGWSSASGMRIAPGTLTGCVIVPATGVGAIK